MLRAARLALADLLARPFRGVLLKALGLTLLSLIALGLGLHASLAALPQFKAHWLNWIVDAIANLGIVLGSIVLAVPVASLCVGFFLDDIARAVERRHYPAREGRSLALWPTLTTTLGFLAFLIVVNLLALPLYFIPGPNVLAWLAINGAILGREYFELAALRHVPPGALGRVRGHYRFSMLACGVLIALVLSIPVLNLLAPLFGTALMVHLFHGRAADA
jgi:CysZ protein